MCYSRRSWREEMARRAREEEELRELLDRKPAEERPTFVADHEPVAEAEEPEPVGAER